MRTSALRCCTQPAALISTTPFASTRRRPTLYLASIRHADGCVETFDLPAAPYTCANDSYGILGRATAINATHSLGSVTALNWGCPEFCVNAFGRGVTH